MSKRILIVISVVFLSSIFIFYEYFRPRTQELSGLVFSPSVCAEAAKTGLIRYIFVERGHEVVAGDRLFALDSSVLDLKASDLSAQVRYENVSVAFAEAKLSQRISEYQFSQDELEKAKVARKTNILSLERVVQADMDSVTLAQHEVSMAQAKLSSAQARLELAQYELRELSPVAPIGGLVTDVFYLEGESVDRGAPVLCISPKDKIKLSFYIESKELSSYPLGTELKLICQNCSENNSASIDHISSKIEYNYTTPAKSLVKLEATLKNADKLISGQFVRLSKKAK